MPYNFAWAVKDDYTYNDYAHEEVADDKGYVKGSYRVLLPDGRTQTVTYTADDNTGYVADVKYDGEAKYPSYDSYKPKPGICLWKNVNLICTFKKSLMFF